MLLDFTAFTYKFLISNTFIYIICYVHKHQTIFSSQKYEHTIPSWYLWEQIYAYKHNVKTVTFLKILQ